MDPNNSVIKRLWCISKSVMIIIFVEFIDQLIDYLINCACLTQYMFSWKKINTFGPSCSKLTMSLVNDSLKFTSSDTQTC